MNQLKVRPENASIAYELADDKGKKLLRDLFPDFFIKDTYLNACMILGTTPKPPLVDKSDKDEVSLDAYHRLTVCIRAKNIIDGKEWQINYDGSQEHWAPRFIKNKAGFGFSHAGYGNRGTLTTVGSRLEYRTYDLMIEGVKEFDQYYQDYLNY